MKLKTDEEYNESLRLLEQGRAVIAEQLRILGGMGLSREEIDRGLEPIRCFFAGFEEDIEIYERKEGKLFALEPESKLF